MELLAAAISLACRLSLGEDLALKDRITVATFYSPHRDAVSSETSLAYRIVEGYSIGIAYQWQPRKFRPVSSVRLVEEAAWHPGLTFQSGVRSMATGLVTDTVSIDKRFRAFELSLGVGYARGQTRGVAGGSYSFRNGFTTSLQADGRNIVTYVTYGRRRGLVLGGYLVDWKHPAYVAGWRF